MTLLVSMGASAQGNGIGGITEATNMVTSFKGLKSQYLFIFAGGLLALFVIFVVMYMAGIDQWVCIGFGVVSASVLVWVTFWMNSKYGEWGLMKLHALRSHPRYIISRRKFLRLFSPTIKNRKA